MTAALNYIQMIPSFLIANPVQSGVTFVVGCAALLGLLRYVAR